MPYRKNEAIARVLSEHQTAGLPLFREENKDLSKRERYLVNEAPRAFPLATDSKKLSHTILNYDKTLLGQKQQVVFEEFMRLGNATNLEVAHSLDWQVSTVCARCFELRELGFIIPAGKRQCTQSGMVVHSWGVK